jgi:hypothetical protein
LFHFNEEEQKQILEKIFNILKDEGRFLSYYPEGDFEGMDTFKIEGKEYRRYARRTPIDEWIKNVEVAGLTKYRRMEFGIGTFRAIEFQK